METIDIIILIALLPGLYLGFKNGLIKQIISFAVVYLGITLSLRFADKVAPYVMEYVNAGEFWAKALSFIIIFAAVALILNILGAIIEKAIGATAVGFVNRILGVLLSLFLFCLIVSVFVSFIDSLNQTTHFISEEKLADSKLYPFMLDFGKTFFPYLKSLF